MNSSPLHRLTSQDFYDYDKCPHRVYLNHNGDEREKLPLSDFLNLLFESALIYELKLAEKLTFQSPEGKTLEEQAESTRRLMAAGAERIYQGVLLFPTDSGRPDLLEKVSGKSSFGDYFYKPVDIKNGSGYKDEERGTLRNDYALQLYHYAIMLNQIQGTFPPVAEILNQKGRRVLYDMNVYAADYAAEMPEVRALVDGRSSDEPVLSSICTQCQWFGHCEPLLVKANDVSLLPDIGRSKRTNLKNFGVVSIQDVPKFDFKSNKIPGFGPKTVESISRNARVVLSGNMEVIQKQKLPEPPLTIFFDFEDDPTQDLIYLAGFLFEPMRGKKDYHYIFEPDVANEPKLWAELQALFADIAKEDFVVFHYGSYEKGKLTQFEKKYGVTEQAALELFRNRMVDLNTVVERTVALPTRNYSLKTVGRFIGFKYSSVEAGGAQSIAWFQEYQADQTKKDLLETLLTYNEEDCRALRAVRDWLVKL
jgi:predicted RecB family nuclease